MPFQIRMGVPEMEQLWEGLLKDEQAQRLDTPRLRLLQRLRKALNFLSADPRHSSLHSHEIEPLSKRYGQRVWQSYLENRTPAAGRMYWIYGPERHDITIIGVEPHPEDRKSSYEKVALSSTPVRIAVRGRKSSA